MITAGPDATARKDEAMISMHCPHCHEALSIPEQYAGRSGACKKCGARIQVPADGAQTARAGEVPAGASGLPDDLTAMLDASFSREPTRPLVYAPSLGDRLQPLLKPLGLALGVFVIAAVVVGGLAYLPELGFESGPGPVEVTQGFVQALNAKDPEQCTPYLTEQSRSNFAQMYPGFQTIDNITVGEATTSGNTSTVQLQVTQFGVTSSSEALLRREAGDWRVHGMRMIPMPGMSMTMDFENPEAILDDVNKMMEDMPPEVRQQMEEAMR